MCAAGGRLSPDLPTGPDLASPTRPYLPRCAQVSHDNALDGLPYKLVQGILGKKEQSNGCPVPVTWFAMFYHSGARWQAAAVSHMGLSFCTQDSTDQGFAGWQSKVWHCPPASILPPPARLPPCPAAADCNGAQDANAQGDAGGMATNRFNPTDPFTATDPAPKWVKAGRGLGCLGLLLQSECWGMGCRASSCLL